MRIKDWNKFQHFKERRPPWIKLYRDLLEDPDWHSLDAKASKVLVMLWLIASEDLSGEGELPDLRHLSFRLRMGESELSKQLQSLNHFVYQGDIKAISGRHQDDILETERETEKETDICTEQQVDSAPSPGEEPVIVFPLSGKEKQFQVFQKDIDEWESSFPAIDVLSSLRRCRQWNIDNPRKRKTQRGIRSHISSWLGRTQDAWRGNSSKASGGDSEWQ